MKNYDITKYDRPSVAADMAVFSIMDSGADDENAARSADNYRKMPKRSLKILLIKRGNHPYKDLWALPGGFCRKDEDVKDTAKRELYEETSVNNAYLQPIGIFGETGRDPRGWVISHTFLALIDGAKCRIKAGSDAWEAHWFDVKLDKKEKARVIGEDTAEIVNEYSLSLQYEDICLSAVVLQKKTFCNYHETVTYEIKEENGFAFDHAKLITFALLSLRAQAEQDGRIVFDLMPETFTLTQLQKAFEIILDRPLLTANFRRKMADFAIETDIIEEGAGHRPAKRFKRNLERFYL